MAKRRNDVKDTFLTHFPEQVSQGMVDFATNVALGWSRYIFTHRQGKKQFGYCTHCHKDFETIGLKHNSLTKCPECNSTCKVKSGGMGRGSMVDMAYFVYYDKSVINPKAIVARDIFVVRDYRENYKDVETVFTDRAMYLFQPGNSKMRKRYIWYDFRKAEGYLHSWEETKSVYGLYNTNVDIYSCTESIEEAVKGTPFQYSTWETYERRYDMIKFFDLYSKYPCIEYLTKLGMQNLVEDKLIGNPTYGAINWRGTSIPKVFRLSKKQLNELRATNKTIDSLTLRLWQISSKDKSKLSMEDIPVVKKEYAGCFRELERVLKYTTFRKANKYIGKKADKKRKGYMPGTCWYGQSAHQILITWCDYISDCVTLQMNLADTRILFPEDLLKAHQETSQRIKTEADKMLDAKIKARLASLEQYCFEHQGLLIRPALSTQELIDEGKALVICVGSYNQGYTRRYANGTTNLLLIRKVSEPDKPYYTLELRKDEIIQVNGKNHSTPDKVVNEFLDAFKAEKLTKKTAKKQKLKEAV